MANGCTKCDNKNRSGGSLDLWKRKGIIPDLLSLHSFSKYEIFRCNQCNEHFVYNGKIFEDCLESQIPALLNWESSLDYYIHHKNEFRSVFKNRVFHSLFSGTFKVHSEVGEEEAIILLYDYPISGKYYTPLKGLKRETKIEFIRLNKKEEIQDIRINKYLVRHNQKELGL